jgi:serine/threonine protein kinase/class 3 adenylate cyclase
MKYCPKCQRQFPRTQRVCSDDGEPLSMKDPYNFIGRTIDNKYRIEALVGIGGMGAVYQAHQLGINRRVAFKILLPHLALGYEGAVALFEREAQLVGQLSHENIAVVFDAGRTNDDTAYMVMEWLDGQTLDEALAIHGRLGLQRTAGILGQIAAALEAAHAAHIIHRDLKPSNVMLVNRQGGRAEREQVKVMDFGIGKVLGDTSGSPVSSVMGTPHYASPEQLNLGASIDGRTDIYSLGVMLYQMLAGVLPFNAPSIPELIRLQQTALPTPLRQLRPELPVTVEQLISRMLMKKPEQRPQSAGEVKALLQEALDSADESQEKTGEDAPTLSLSAEQIVTTGAGSASRAAYQGQQTLLSNPDQSEHHLKEFRLFLDEICCNLCRFEHADQEGLAPEQIKINQAVYLGIPGCFAGIRGKVPGAPTYYVEVKYGFPSDQIAADLARKYGVDALRLEEGSKVILVVDVHERRDWPELQQRICADMQTGLALEVWDEEHLSSLIQARFGLEIDLTSEDKFLDLRVALDHAKGQYAFEDDWTGDELQSSLLWHFGFWRLKQLRQRGRVSSRSIVPPGMYRRAVVVIADFCSFSSYVRDTRDEEVVRHCLTSFYSKVRYEVLNTGGMMYQFLGDQAIGIYGIPDQPGDYLQAALECAEALVDIGESVSTEWQRQIDRVQSAQGVHIGIAMGDLQVVSLRPFGRAHLGAVSNGINMAALLLAHAGPSEIVVNNGFYQGLEKRSQADFLRIEPIEVRELGRVNAWKNIRGEG